MCLVAFYSCKSKGDWRVKYQAEKKKKTEVQKTSKNDAVFSEDLFINKQLYKVVKDWYGTPYLYGGGTRDGVDCSGFVQNVYAIVYDKKLPRQSAEMAKNIKRKYTKNLEEGDLVFFAFGKSKKISHVGIYLSNNKFVHASTSKGVVISDITSPWYSKYLVRCGTPQF